MTIIFCLLLTLGIIPHAIFSYPLLDSDFQVQLKSENFSQKSLLPKLDCSCQINVYPVYDIGYSFIVKNTKTNQTHAKLQVKSTQNCLIMPLQNGIATFPLSAPKYHQQNDEITQTYFIGFISQREGNYFYNQASHQSMLSQSCFAGDEIYFYRQAYLINQTKLETDQYSYKINLPLYAIGFTQLLVLALLLALTHNIKYRRFTPFTFNFIFSVLYAVFLFVTVYVQTKLQDKSQIFFWIVLIFSVVFASFYFIDLTSVCLNKGRLIVFISIILSITLMVVDILILPDVWYINNLLGVLVAGALIKFIVIKKLKSAVFPLLFLWLFFILRQFPLTFKIQQFHEALQTKIIPLFLQLPLMINDDQQGYVCSAFGTSKLITMGLLMNYSVRVDLFLSSHFYTTLCTIIATICLGLQYFNLVMFDNLPVLQYSSVILFIPLMLILVLTFAAKRGEWAVIWHGSFHDMAVDRKSIRRESSYLDEEQLNRNIQQLKMNPSLLTNN